MTQEDKELLLKDLCARLPYGVKCIEKTPIEDFQDKNLWKIDRIRADTFMFGMSNCYVCYGQYDDITNIKPYLFPLSSMTEEQREELYKIGWYLDGDKIYSLFRNYDDTNYITHIDCFELVNWCYKNNFDINGLIPKGSAIDATGLNIY